MSGSTTDFLKVGPRRNAELATAGSAAAGFVDSVLLSFRRVLIGELRAAWFSAERARELVPALWSTVAVGLSAEPELEYRRTAPRKAWLAGHQRWAGFEDARLEDGAPEALIDQFRLRRELIGRVRDVDRDAGEFVAVLNDRDGDTENELAGRFPLGILADEERARLEVGMTFYLVTGYRRVMTISGEVLKTGLETRVVVRRPPPPSEALLAGAANEARRLRGHNP